MTNEIQARLVFPGDNWTMNLALSLRIGDESTEVLASRRLIQIPDLCFPLQLTRNDVKNALQNGAIPSVTIGRMPAVEIEQLTAWLLDRNELLGIEFVRGFAQGRFSMPRTVGMDDQPESLLSRLELLDRPIPADLWAASKKSRESFPQRENSDTSRCCRTLKTSGSQGGCRKFKAIEPHCKAVSATSDLSGMVEES